jgi:hypothetical protein
MIRKLVFFLLIFLSFLCGFYVSQNISKKDLDKLTLEKKQCQTQLQDVLTSSKKRNDQDLNLYAQKTQALEKVVESTLYFSSRVSSLSPIKKEVALSMLGGASMKSDASDLVMGYTDNLKIVEIIPGTVFPTYPRKALVDGKITITGITSLENNEIKFGNPNNVFATLVIEKTGDPLQKGILTVDKSLTQIYLQGTSIIDTNKSVTQIEL